MGDDNSDFDRLLAGDIGADDPDLGRVAAFLGRMQAHQELPSVAHLEAAHRERARASLPAPDDSPTPGAGGGRRGALGD